MALAIKAQAIGKAIRVLEDANIAYTQPLPGKLVIEPPRDVPAGLIVTFWPARARIQIQKQSTKRLQDLDAFQQALANQGHRIAGYLYTRPKPPALLRFERAQAKRVKRWVQRQTDIEEAQDACDEIIAIHLQRLKDFAAGVRIGRQNPKVADAENRFKRARRRAMRRDAQG